MSHPIVEAAYLKAQKEAKAKPLVYEFWYEDTAWYAACRMGSDGKPMLSTGSLVYLDKKIKQANQFQFMSGIGEFIDWDYQNNGGLVIRRSLRFYLKD
jgi:hypothetical protein